LRHHGCGDTKLRTAGSNGKWKIDFQIPGFIGEILAWNFQCSSQSSDKISGLVFAYLGIEVRSKETRHIKLQNYTKL